MVNTKRLYISRHYGDLEVGDVFVILSSGKRCVKTAHGAVSLEDGKRVLLFSTSAVRKLDGKLTIE